MKTTVVLKEKKKVERRCMPSLKMKFKKMTVQIYCNTCGDALWEIITNVGTSFGCRTCTSTHKVRKSKDY